ncbi:S9 family peptidase [Oceanicoccus sagamiensis]|uniref:Peptidase S9 n=1 Tax=Oceanicoccus sagamiensis TaxID=716816 RepID=A0A1X9N9D2_9GAMM|nr:DPP IV N-terminal domain-containing protein [Oceanicoccus sagamiensis]ARN73791.1 hypothetical protein BST96_06490 [Oceanicoccus sagamiensis]
MKKQQIKSDNDTLAARYQRAKTLIEDISKNHMVLNATLYPVWIKGSACFWYERKMWDSAATTNGAIKPGKQYRLVNAVSASNEIAFDHKQLANALEKAANKQVDPNDLPISAVAMTLNLSSSLPNNALQTIEAVRFTAFKKQWCFVTQTGVCSEISSIPKDWELSPDKKKAAFIKGHNIWVCDLEAQQDTQLTHDGEKDYAYGAMSTVWGRCNDVASAQVRWSPDSNKLFTLQRDTRKVLSLPIVHHVPADGGIRPQLEEIKVGYPGDEHAEQVRLLAIDVITGEIRPADYPQISATRNGYGFFSSQLGWWANDSQRAYFVDVARDYKMVQVVEFNTHTGATKVLLTEHSLTQINLMLGGDDYPTMRPLPETNELLWFSERSGWGHLYLYDLNTGTLKNTVTSGEWLVRNIAHFDQARREVFLQTAARDSTIDPYYRDLVRVNIDTSELITLTASNHDNVTIVQTEFSMGVARSYRDVSASCGIHPLGDFAVITQSRADEMPVSFLINRDGDKVMELEVADASALPSTWQWPEPVQLLAADGQTDIYGLVFRPSDFSPERSYPVISHGFNNPEIPWVGKGSFTNDVAGGWPTMDAAALAELGFIVVQIDGRGTVLRNKAFHDECYGSFQTASCIDDHVAGIRQLAQRFPYMDPDRVGITAHSSGGSGCIEGMLRYPEFFKVGVSSCVHDSRLMSAPMMAEKYEGLSGPKVEHSYAEERIDQLQGKLLLIHGMLDWCISPASTFRLVEALKKADKDFDMLLLPKLGHSHDPYVIRRTWDYFVAYLQGVSPQVWLG